MPLRVGAFIPLLTYMSGRPKGRCPGFGEILKVYARLERPACRSRGVRFPDASHFRESCFVYAHVADQRIYRVGQLVAH
jgi:hypothetical protein